MINLSHIKLTNRDSATVCLANKNHITWKVIRRTGRKAVHYQFNNSIECFVYEKCKAVSVSEFKFQTNLRIAMLVLVVPGLSCDNFDQFVFIFAKFGQFFRSAHEPWKLWKTVA